MMPLRNRQKLIQAIEKSARILLPEQIVQEYAHGVEAERFGPPELAIDGLRIECRRLPHLQLIDGSARHEIASHHPAGRIAPRSRTFAAPDRAPLRVADGGHERDEKERGDALSHDGGHRVTPNWKRVRERYCCPGRRIVDGKFG